jgi:hypothetical protein
MNDLISTKQYGRIIGIDIKEHVWVYLQKLKLIKYRNKSFELTDEGHKLGEYISADNGEISIGWNKALLDKIFHPIVSKLTEGLDFELFHLTHIKNLISILDQGLKCHNDAPSHIDISDQAVNSLRDREIKYFGNLHDYVPLYFNPRNAMLSVTCKKFNDEIIILEIKKEIITKDNTLFCQGNAARGLAHFIYCKKKVALFDWDMINSKSTNCDTAIKKSKLMSESLIYKHIPSSHIKRIHCKDISTANKVSALIKANIQEVQISPELYF